MSLPVSDLRQSPQMAEQANAANRTFYLFGPFKLDLATGSLYRDGREVELRPKNFELLLYLVNNPGRLITKDDCLEHVWPDCIVTENVLTQGIAELRKAFGDDSHRPRFIKTVPRRGYIFIAEVQTVDNRRGDEPGSESEAREPIRTTAWPWRPWHSPGMGGLFVGLVLGVLLVWLSPRFTLDLLTEAVFSSSVQENTVAVIPFEVESDAPGYEWLGRGVADMISSGLAPSPHLNILNYDRLIQDQNQSGRFSGPFRRSAAMELAKKAGAAHVVTGTLRKEAGKVQLVVQLIDGTTDAMESQRSAETDRLNEILAIVEQLSLQVLQDILREKAELANTNGRHIAEVTTNSLGAYQHYVAALTKYQYGGKLGSDAALIELRKAVRIDPSFAMAYFKIAEIKEWRRLWGYSTESPESALREAARHMSQLPEKERLLIQGLQALSEADSRKAFAIWKDLERLYPQYALDVGIPVRILEIYLDWGRLQEAIDYGEALANSSVLAKADQARLCYRLSSAFSETGDLENSLRYAQRSVSLWPLKDSPVFVLYLVKLGRAHLFAGDRSQAMDYFAQARNLAGEDAVYLTNIAWGYYFAGEMEKALQLVHLGLAADSGYGNALHLRGWIRLARGNYQQAAADLAGAYEKTPARFGSAFHQIIGGDLAALYYAGVAHEKLADEERARQTFQQLLNKCEQNRQALFQNGMSFLQRIQTLFLETLASVRLGREADLSLLARELESEADQGVGLYKQMARLHALTGDPAGALTWLEKAIDRGDRKYQHIYDTPDFENLRDHPRFYQLVTKNLSRESAEIALKN